MKIVNTDKWAIKPNRRYLFRVGTDTYKCWFTIGRYSVIQYIRTEVWEW